MAIARTERMPLRLSTAHCKFEETYNSRIAEVFERVLIVCIGNICRSPCAQILLEEAIAGSGVKVASAGLAAKVGQPIEASTRSVLLEHRHALPEHRARQLDGAMLQAADLVLAMERRHIEHIHHMAPEARGKTFLLGKWQGELEIADPYRRDRTAFEQAYRDIEKGVEAWAKRLRP